LTVPVIKDLEYIIIDSYKEYKGAYYKEDIIFDDDTTTI
jgi:hypothetical protein